MSSSLKIHRGVFSAPLFKTSTLSQVLPLIKSANSGTSSIPLEFDSGDFPKEIRNVSQFRTLVYLIVMEAAENPMFLSYAVKYIRGQVAMKLTRQMLNKRFFGLELQLRELLGSQVKAFNAVSMTLEAFAALERAPEETKSFYKMFHVAAKAAEPFVNVVKVNDPMVESIINRADYLIRESQSSISSRANTKRIVTKLV